MPTPRPAGTRRPPSAGTRTPRPAGTPTHRAADLRRTPPPLDTRRTARPVDTRRTVRSAYTATARSAGTRSGLRAPCRTARDLPCRPPAGAVGAGTAPPSPTASGRAPATRRWVGPAPTRSELPVAEAPTGCPRLAPARIGCLPAARYARPVAVATWPPPRTPFPAADRHRAAGGRSPVTGPGRVTG
ncbi:hypothetical protein C6W10_24505 [Plantactinospora sp. BB1]|nr:hypothetical protein C6W10_24505 [Plantactinospora sp. BB1]